jgi:hypothetical protein
MASLKKAIEDMCKSCIYDPLDTGSWRNQVENCNCTSCPLWNVRPTSIKTRDANRNKGGKITGPEEMKKLKKPKKVVNAS